MAFLLFLVDALGGDVPITVGEESAIEGRGRRDQHRSQPDQDGEESFEEKYVAPCVDGRAGNTPAWDLG
jgi:hypothetical protein